MSFSSLGLNASLTTIISEQGFEKPYPIQKEAIPVVLKGRDVLGIAKTGSGKTASYVLPIIHKLQRRLATKNRHVNVLVLVPTRELATQVRGVFEEYITKIPERIKSLAVFGGVSINPQMIAMQNVNILVATPGRLIELVESKAVHLSDVECLVLDEADKMLNKDFKKEIDQILSWLPAQRQNLLFSATLNDQINTINQLILHKPEVIKIASEVQEKDHLDSIKQIAYLVPEEKKGPLLRHLITSNNWNQVLVFTSSTYKADLVEFKLRKNGIDAAAVHRKKSTRTRNEGLRKFKEGTLKVLVATDLLSRGIDIEFLPYVINYELPRSPKDYIHRIGRTGRAEASGNAISFVSPDAEHHFNIIQKKMKKTVETINSNTLDF